MRKKYRDRTGEVPSAPSVPLSKFTLANTNLTTEGSKLTKELRQVKVAELVLKFDWTQESVAGELGISVRTVRRDLRDIRKMWSKRREYLTEQWMDEDLAKMQILEGELWAQWERSHDPKYATLLLQCLAERRKMMTALQFRGDPSTRGAIQATYVQLLVNQGDLPRTRLKEYGFEVKQGEIIDAQVVEGDNGSGS